MDTYTETADLVAEAIAREILRLADGPDLRVSAQTAADVRTAADRIVADDLTTAGTMLAHLQGIVYEVRRPMSTNEPRTQAGRALSDYMRGSFVYEADDTEPVNITDRILAIEAEAERSAGAAPIDVDVLPKHLRGDGPCGDCGTLDNIVWFTENVLWNAVTGEQIVAEQPRAGILCIPCFVKRADAAGLQPTGWRFLAEWPWRTRLASEGTDR